MAPVVKRSGVLVALPLGGQSPKRKVMPPFTGREPAPIEDGPTYFLYTALSAEFLRIFKVTAFLCTFLPPGSCQ